jgi:hypothetical protein
MTLPGLVLGLLVLGVVDRLSSRRSGRSPRTSAAGLETLGAVFAPGKVHELKQRQTELLWREDEVEGAPPRDHVDLERGIARITRSRKQP